MKINKKKLIYVVASVIIFVVITIGTFYVLKTFKVNNKPQVQTAEVTQKTKADALLLDATATTDAAAAKTLLLKARQQYVDIKDQDRVQAVDAMILLIDNTPKKK